MVVRFDDNACALISKSGEPIGTRINGTSSLLKILAGNGIKVLLDSTLKLVEHTSHGLPIFTLLHHS